MQNVYSGKNLPKLLSSFLLAAAIAALAGCSDNTASSGTTPTPTGATTAASIQLLVSSQQMLSSATASTVLTAVVLDATGQTMSGKAVIFSKGADSSAYFSNITATTGTDGVATATLNIGTNMANRVVSVSATVDTAVGTNTVTVTGTTIAISGNTSLALNASTALSVIVKDSTGVAVPGVTLTVASQNGNNPNPAIGITDSTGQITATVTATNAGTTGTDVLTVTGAGASQTQTLTINSASFAITAPVIVAPATTPEIVVNTATPVTVLWTVAGVPQAGLPVYFYSSRGTITGSPATTNASGIATASVSAGSTGATIFTASGASGTPAATLNVVFITTTADSITAQASPSTVAVNTSGSTVNQSVISVIVRDVNNNLVKNAHVIFSQVADASGGSLAANTATTDITGTASVNYIAGTTSSGQNAVEISATVDTVNGVAMPIPNKTSSVFLTVASQLLYVRLGTDNKIYPDTPVVGTHTKEYTALVTDAAGTPAPDGTEVRFVLRPSATPYYGFWKGYYTWVVDKWVQTQTVGCMNEDLNWDGILQPGEDLNGNTRLDPLGVATVNATATTTNGFAIAKISYAKEYSWWVQNDLEARAGTGGNDPPAVVTVELPGAAADYTSETIMPPGQFSPFGVTAVCNNVL